MNVLNTLSVKQNSAQGFKILCLSCLFGVSFVAMMTPAQAQSNDVLNRLDRIENEINTLGRAVYKGEKPPAGAYAGSSVSPDVEVRMQQLETQLRDLTGQIEQQTYDIEQLKQRVEMMRNAPRGAEQTGMMMPSGQPPMPTPPAKQQLPLDAEPELTTMPQGQMVAPRNEDPAPPTGMHRAQPAQINDPAGQYEQAFAYLKAGDYGAAEQGFQSFLDKNPGHALSANAIYWLGETFYVRGQFEPAAKVFAEAYQKYPGGPKGADNLLKLGMSLGGAGKKKEACIALSQLSKEYPNGPGPILRRAEQEMARFDCR